MQEGKKTEEEETGRAMVDQGQRAYEKERATVFSLLNAAAFKPGFH